eukprot:Sspe_Gene.100222::Locus_74944_Transcript_2_2_Confidence_0.667_Length_1664::g.100222::m.100222/K09014/sufB; Fe-S cluster assembly protein SufB
MAAVPASAGSVEEIVRSRQQYKHGFHTKVAAVHPAGVGLNEGTVRRISELREEPQWLTEFRVKAYRHLLTLRPPKWARADIPVIDLQKLAFFSEPQKKPTVNSLDEVHPEVIKTFKKLGIPLDEQKRLANVATDVVFDSTSVVTTFKEELHKAGVVFCSLREAVQRHPELVKKYLGKVVPLTDNYWATLNAAVFSDGSFVHVPKGVKCPMELSTYFRINDKEAGQFERTLIVAEEGASVSYLEGCTAPEYNSKQLHAAVVELYAAKDARIDYSTVQNWYPGDPKTGEGGVLNFVTKRGLCAGDNSLIRWSQVEAGAAITWKYPSCVLKGKGSTGEFYSVSLTTGKMQADTGTKMIHVGDDTKSTIISKSISADSSSNTYRGLVVQSPGAKNVRNFTQCDSMLIGRKSRTSTIPIIKASGPAPKLEHEAVVSHIDEDQLHYLRSRGLDNEQSIRLLVGGFCHDVVKKLPLEFASEASALLGIKLADAVG